MAVSGRMKDAVSCEIEGLSGMLDPKRRANTTGDPDRQLSPGDRGSDP
jgi:hypothetical protein